MSKTIIFMLLVLLSEMVIAAGKVFQLNADGKIISPQPEEQQ